MQDAEKMGNCSKEVMVAFSETFGFFLFVCLFVCLFVVFVFFFLFFFFSGEIIFSTVKIKQTLRTNEGFSYEVFCCVTLQRSLSYLHHASAENFYIQDAKGPLNYFLFTLTPFGKKNSKACWKTLIAWLPDCLPLKLVSASECLQTEFGKDR